MRTVGSFILGLVLFIVLVVVVLQPKEDPCGPGSSTGVGGSVDGSVPDGAYALPEKDALAHITSGWRTAGRPDHRGVDIAQGAGTPLFAFADGVVAEAGPASGFGNWVVINHELEGQTFSTVYGHIFTEGIHVKPGDHVKAGTHIADEGYNGKVEPAGPSGSHLHFEVWEGGRLSGGHDVDPMPWLKKAVEPGSAPHSGSSSSADVVIIGDSLTVGAKNALAKALPNATIDAVVGRQYSAGLRRLKEMKPKTKVVAMLLGTNGPFTQHHIDDTLTAAGGARVVLMTVGGPNVSAAVQVNPLVRLNADTVGIVDWAEEVARNPSYIGADGVHPTPPGSNAFVNAVLGAVKHASGSSQTAKKRSAPSGELPSSPVIQSEEHLQVDTIRIARAVAYRFPQIQTIGGWRPYDPYPDHPSGRAADIMIPNWNTAEGKQLGDDILDYLWSNREYFQVQYFIWQQTYRPVNGQSSVMEDRGSPTANHYDHIHVTTIGHGFPKPGQTYGPAPEGGSDVPGDATSMAHCEPIAGVDAGLNDVNIPAEFVPWITRAGRLCTEISAPLVAGVIYQESRFNPQATSPAGARGPAQFMPGTWAGVGAKADEEGNVVGPPGSGDPTDIADAVMASGRYLCGLAKDVSQWKAEGKVAGDTVQLVLASYNAGGGNVLRHGGVPPFQETQNYVRVIPEYAKKFSDASSAEDVSGSREESSRHSSPTSTTSR